MLVRFLFLIIALVIGVVILSQKLFFSGLPDVEGRVSSSFLSEEVIVRRDEYGIPELTATNEKDLYFSMGYIHAQDRMWQLEVQRRISSGTLSELFGKSAVRQDSWIRTLGLKSSSEEAVKHLSPEAIASLQAYVDGINFGIDNNKNLPFEFSFFNIKPKKWTVLDSISWSKIFSLNLSGNYRHEVQRLIALQYLDNDEMVVFYPYDQKINKLNVYKNSLHDDLSALLLPANDLEERFSIGGKNVGSNAWVVSGKYTKSGKPLLANDPHLSLQIPSLWYAVKQSIAGNNEISGMSLVGLPVVIFGRNKNIAWGGTNMMADVQDLNIETVNPENPKEYLIDGHWEAFSERVETINVRSDFPSSLREPLAPVEILVRNTRFGPVITDNLSFNSAPISLRWVSLDDNDTTYESFYRLNHARNWNEFLQATSHHVAPALNLFYADVEGNIGFKGVGRIPVRRSGDGTLPTQVTSLKGNWDGYIPFNEMPTSFNPESGYLLNANNKNVPKDYSYDISHEFAHPARANRIEQILQNSIADGKGITVESTQTAQHDSVDLSAKNLLEVMIQLEARNQLQSDALKLLKDWSLTAERNSVAATIYYSWFYHLKRQVFNDELQGYWNNSREKSYLSSLPALVYPETLADLLATHSHWCDDTNTDSPESCEQVLAESFQSSLNDLISLYGDDISEWRWEDAQETLYRHIPFSEMKVFDVLFERRIATDGAANAINASSSIYSDKDGFETVFGAGFRQIMEMSVDAPQHYLMNSTGQSGHIASEHYDDMMYMFNRNELIDMSQKNYVSTLRLSPLGREE